MGHCRGGAAALLHLSLCASHGRSWLQTARSSKLPLQQLTAVLPAFELRDRLLAYWTTIGVSCALLATISANSYLYPVNFNHFTDPSSTKV